MEKTAEKYLRRIGLNIDGNVASDGELLRKIQYAHVTTVPYENSDIVKGIDLSLDYDDLYKKVVLDGRGGYCFELNGIYAWLLRELGFSVTEYMGRFLRGETQIPMRRHRILRVVADGRDYLCDAGVGNVSPRYPLLLEEGTVQTQFGESYRFRKDDFLGWVLTELHKGEWRDVFSFTEEKQLNIDYIMPSYYCEKHPDSVFNKAWMFSIKTDVGRKTLDSNVFKVFEGTSVVSEQTLTEEEIRSVVPEVFGFNL